MVPRYGKTAQNPYTPPMPPVSDRRGRSGDGNESAHSGTGVPLKGCRCNNLTPVRQLCPVHKAERERILNRIKHRKQRARQAGRNAPDIDLEGAITIPGPAADHTARILDELTQLQVRIVDAYTRAGKDLPPRYAEMFRYHAALRAALRPVLAQSREELIEVRRPTSQKEWYRRIDRGEYWGP